ncbi:MAG: PQQ-dependent sugar dehydrogenase [Geodermatophilaceae bacterium]|nr:PQQ-dependent sugar dehydrogenase [Geodermatophilaceae bacterium]
MPPPPDPGQPAPPPQSGAEDPNVIASGLDTPWGLAQLPDGSAIVGERRTGRILKVFPDRSPPLEIMTIPGLDSTGDGGLLGLALSPAYTEDALVYAYATTATDNRLLRFTLGGTPQAILTGIPKGATGNGGRIAFGPDELLYVGTGDTGRPELSADAASLAGKVLRLDIFGKPAPDNPVSTSPVWTRGHSNITGLCFDGADRLFVTESLSDEFSLLEPGADYGWRNRPVDADVPTRVFPDAGLGGCGILNRVAFLGAVDGERILIAILDGNGDTVGEPEEFLPGSYGRLRTVVVDPIGALWITTSNLDGPGQPAPTDDRVLRVPPPSEAGGGVS